MRLLSSGITAVFDIETEPFSESFSNATAEGHRIDHAPMMRVACVRLVCGRSRKYRFFTPENSAELIRCLLSANRIVSFNGRQFDLLVLRKHHQLSHRQMVAINRKHVDLYEVFSSRFGSRLSLDTLTRMNLGERKMRKGREMSNLGLDDLKVACKSDVSQTHALYRLECNGKVILPRRRIDPSVFDCEPNHHLPSRPEGYMRLDITEMSEGQMAEYLAGTWGVTNFGELVEM